jgi:N-formylglutamate deformylase
VGTIVPMAIYGNDKRVSSIMIEVNRSLYMEEATGEKSKGFDLVREQIQEVLKKIGEFDRS